MGYHMMEEGDVNHLCDKLKVTELENEENIVELQEVVGVVNRGKKCLLVKLLSSKYFNREASKSTLKKIWHPAKSLCFSEIGEGLLLVDFEDYNDKQRFMHNGPWSFNKSLILVKEFNMSNRLKPSR